MSESWSDLAINHLNEAIRQMNEGRHMEATKELELAEMASMKIEIHDVFLDVFLYTQTIKGHLKLTLGVYEEALKINSRNLKAVEELISKDPDNELYLLIFQKNLGAISALVGIFYNMGQIIQAENCFELYLSTSQKLLQKNPGNVTYQKEIALSLSNLGTLLYAMGRLEEAKQKHEKALEIHENLLRSHPENVVYQSNLAMTFNNLGALLKEMGSLEEAKQNYEKALELHEQLLHAHPENIMYQSNVGGTLSNLGALLNAMGRLEEAKQKHEKALEIHEKLLQTNPENIVYKLDLSTSLNELGNLFRNIYCLEEAIQSYEKALEIREKLLQTNPENETLQSYVGTTLNNLGLSLSDMGCFKEAIQSYEKALEIREKLLQTNPENVTYQLNIANSLNDLGNLFKNMDYLEEAKQSYEKALEISEKLFKNDPENVVYQSDVAMMLNNLGNLFKNIGFFEEAKQSYEKALKMSEKLLKNDPENVVYKSDVAMTLLGIGGLLYRQEDYQAALDFNLNALKGYALNSGNLSLIYRVYASIGRCYEKLKDNDNAFTNYKASIECIESIRSYYTIEKNKMDIMWDKSTPYTEMISFLCTSKFDSDTALEYLERFKSRTLLDSLRFNDIEAPVSVPTTLIEQEKKLLESIRVVDRLIRKNEKADNIARLTKMIKGKETELNEVYDHIRDFASEYVDLRKGQPLGIKEIKELIESQKKKTAFVEYFTTAEKVFVFVITSDEIVSKVEIVDLNDKSLRGYFLKYLESIQNEGEIGEIWEELSQKLIDPVFKFIRNCELVYLIPHGLLHYLPLHALCAEKKRLIEHFPIVYSPSLTALKYSQSKPDRKFETCLSIGYTPYDIEKKLFEGEASLVAVLFNAEPKLGSEATSKILKNANDDVIHISCHGGFDWENSLNSGLRLADKDLKLNEIFDLDLSTNLLVLSACETGLNERKTGDELIGFTRAFQYAGAKSLVVSLWSVRADSTYKFMGSFYKKIKEDKMNKAEALQKTQVEFIHDKQYLNPYLWAPFILIGDWK